MRESVDRVLTRYGGAATRRQLLAGVPADQLDDEIRRGRLSRVFARTYCRPWDHDVPAVRQLAALHSVGSPVALSHLTALAARGLIEAPEDIHVTVPASRGCRHQPGLVVHREIGVPTQTRVAGLPTATSAVAAITCWPLLTSQQRRAPVIAAVRQRLTTPDELTQQLLRRPRLPGRRELAGLIDLLAAGCESELEIWGLQRTFNHPALRHGVRQHCVQVRGRGYRLDLAFERERVAVELDGDAFHSTRVAREHDRRRDADLATIGWLTVRFTYRRLHDDPAGCLRDLLAILVSRR